MSEGSIRVLIALSAIILVLSFKDLLVSNTVDQSVDDSSKSDIKTTTTNEADFNEDEILKTHNFDDDEILKEPIQKEIPKLKINNNNLQQLKFLFCISWGYRNLFEQYSNVIRSKYPNLEIIGDNYPPPKFKSIIAQVLSVVKLMVIVMIISGQNPFLQLNMQTPRFFEWATQNKFYACLMIFFTCNAIETHLVSTGAFEIYLNNMQIWSKLSSDRVPHEKELLQMIDMNLNLESYKHS